MTTKSKNRILRFPLTLESKLRLFDLGVIGDDAFTAKEKIEISAGVTSKYDLVTILADW